MAPQRAMMAIAWLGAAGIMAMAVLVALEASANLQARSWAEPEAFASNTGLAANSVGFDSPSTDQEAPERIRLSKRSRKGSSRSSSHTRGPVMNRRHHPQTPILSYKRQRLPSFRARQAAMDAAAFESTLDESSDTGSEILAKPNRSPAFVEAENLSEASSDDQICAGSPKAAECVRLARLALQVPQEPPLPENAPMDQGWTHSDLPEYRPMPIAAVQSKFYRSPFEGQLVVVTGVVTMIRPRKRFRQQNNSPKSTVDEVIGTFLESIEPSVVFLQAPDTQWDLDHRTSEALMVRLAPVSYTEDYPNALVPGGLAVGDTIEVYGKVAEERYDADSLMQTAISEVVRVNIVHRVFRSGGSDFLPSMGTTALRRLEESGITPVTLNAPRPVPAGLSPQAFYQPTRQLFVPDPYDLSVPKQRIEDLVPPLTLNPSERGIDFFKALEHMVVRIRAPVVLGPQLYNGVVVLADGGKYSSGLAPNGPVVAMARNSSAGRWVATYPERLVVVGPLDRTRRPKVNAGDRLDDIVGILSYSHGRYHVVPFTAYSVVAAAPGQVERLAAAPVVKYSVPAGGCRPLRVVSYNVENLYGKQHQRIGTLASHLVLDLGMPDIVALQEIQDADGPRRQGSVSADETLTKIVGALSVATGGLVEYAFAQIDPEDNNIDGGQPFGNIRPAFLYRRDTVQLAPSAAGRAGMANESVHIVNRKQLGGTTLSVNPGRIDPHLEAFAKSRKPLAAAFDLVGEQVRGARASTPPKRVFVVNVHLSSKFGSSPWHTSLQPPTNAGENRRAEQVQALTKFRDELLAVAATSSAATPPHLVVIGDMNEAAAASPLRQFAQSPTGPNGALVPVMDTLPEIQRYSYVHNGMGQLLDHIFATRQLAARLRYVSVLHINTPFANDAPSRYALSYSPSGQTGGGGSPRKVPGDSSDASLSPAASPRRIMRVVRRPAHVEGSDDFMLVDEIESRRMRKQELDIDEAAARRRGARRKQDRVDASPRRGTKRPAEVAADIPSDGPERAGSRKAPRREGFWARILERIHGALRWFMPVGATRAEADSTQVSVNPRLVRRGNNLRITIPPPVDISTATSTMGGGVPETPGSSGSPRGRSIFSDHDPLVADFDLCR